ncbi:XRE family transcriptional regulator [Paraburkholderia xenovorans]
MLYRSPTAAQMKNWKERLQFSGTQMARILGLKTSRRWREYAEETNPAAPRIPPANLFMGAAMTVLPPADIERVLREMRRIGAFIDLDADVLAPDGEQQP